MEKLTNEEVYELLDDQWHSLDSKMDDLIAAATTQQGETLMRNWKQANKNAMNARIKIFATNDKKIIALFEKTKDAQKSIDVSLANLKEIVSSLQKLNDLILNISKVVALGTKLVGVISVFA